MNFANVVNFSFLYFSLSATIYQTTFERTRWESSFLFLSFFAIEKEQNRIEKGEEKW